MQKILITGAAGMLGSKISNHLLEENKFDIFGTGRKEIQSSFKYIRADLLNDDELDNLLAFVKPDIIVHCAAIVDLNSCEQHKDETEKMHVDVTKKLASYNSDKCRFIYISTDSVFDGLEGNYTETSKPAPLNFYALSKLNGEIAALKANEYSLVIRTNIYGFNHAKTGKSLFEWIYGNLSNGHIITGFKDVIFNPLYTGQLAELITMLINKNITGILNAGCEEKISKFQFAQLIANAFNFDRSLIKAGISSDLPSVLQRPKNTTLNTGILNGFMEKGFSINDGIDQLKADFVQQKILHD